MLKGELPPAALKGQSYDQQIFVAGLSVVVYQLVALVVFDTYVTGNPGVAI